MKVPGERNQNNPPFAVVSGAAAFRPTRAPDRAVAPTTRRVASRSARRLAPASAAKTKRRRIDWENVFTLPPRQGWS